MSTARDFCCLIVSLAMPAAVELSVMTGVDGCGQSRSLSNCRITMASFMFVNRAASSASEAAETTIFRIPAGLRMAPLETLGLSGRLPK